MKYSDYIMIGVWIACILMQYFGVRLPGVKSIAKKKNIHRFIRTLVLCATIYPVSVFTTLTHFEVVILTFLLMIQSLISLEWGNQIPTDNLPGAKGLAYILQGSTIVAILVWTLFQPISILFGGILVIAMLPRKYQSLDSGLSAILWILLVSSRIIS